MAKKLGLSFETLEQDTLGGTVYTFPRSKIVMTNPMDLPLHGNVKLFNTSKDELISLWVNVLDENDIQITENTKVDRIIPIEDHFKVVANNGKQYLTNQVLIAIGRRGTPRKLGVDGETLEKVSYRLLEPEQIKDKKILVVGGGDSAVESAMLLMDNNEVSLSYRKEKFARIKQQNQLAINKAIESGKINTIMSSNVTKISELSVDLKLDDDELKLPNDQVYIFIGGELPTGFLKQCGIEIKKRFGYIMKKHG
jgi:thioredoxin reductase